jgi:hypothetical protein
LGGQEATKKTTHFAWRIQTSGWRGRDPTAIDKTAVPTPDQRREPQADDDPAVPGKINFTYWHWR